MSQTINAQLTSDSPLNLLYAPIADELSEVEAILRGELRSDYAYVDELVQYGCLLGGKRLRPALLLLTARALGEICREHLVLGAVVEMIHTATLVHDDVLDDADMRRHLATVNSRWDNEASVLLGDFLFTHAFYLASTLETTWACRAIGRATNRVCEGELRQKGSRGDFTLSEQAYLSIIEAKTAELCACSCKLGAYFAGAAAEIVERMEQFGRDLGTAFQIADDLLDVLGDEQATGKSLGTDLDQRIPTLPLIHVLEQAEAGERQRLLDVLNGHSPQTQDALNPFFEKYSAIQYTRDRAGEFAARARDSLAFLPPGVARERLQILTEFVVERSQ